MTSNLSVAYMKHNILKRNRIKHNSSSLPKQLLNRYVVTFTLAEEAGKVTRTSISNAGGGIKRSPFLTAPFTKIVRAFGVDKILEPKKEKNFRLQNEKFQTGEFKQPKR